MILSNPLFLIGLVAVGVPIAVHLFNFRRYHKVYFSNVDRLEELQQETRKQSRLREYLILMLRVLFVIFLVVAFAQPVITRKSQNVKRGGSAISVYIDNSYSMENTGREGQLLETARQKAREIVAAYKPGDRYQLLTNSAQGSEFRWLSREEFLSALDDVQSVPVTVSMSTMVQRQHDFLHTSNADNMHAYVISDCQKSTTDVAMMHVDSLISTTFVPLEGTKASNVFIDTLVFNAPVFYQGSTITASVSIVNSGSDPVEKVPVRLYVKEKERAIASVDIDADSRTTVDLTFVIDEGGVLDGRVEISDYPITFDDQLFFVFNIREKIRALEVDGTAENPSLHRLYVGDSAFDYRAVPMTQMDYSLLSKMDYIVLNELVDVPSGLSQALQSFVKEGGSLAIIPSEKSNVDSYNQMLAQFKAPKFSMWRSGKAQVGRINVGSSLYSNVFEGKNDDLEHPSALGYYKMTADGGTVRESLMSFENGDDLLSMTLVGAGRVFLFAAPLRQEMTDFVQQALFVPTLYNMALYSRPAPAPYAVLNNGQTILLNALEIGEVSRLRDLEGRVDLIPDIRRVDGRYYLVTHGEITDAGNYRVTTASGEEGLAFNYSRQESELSYFSGSEIQHLLKDSHLDGYDVIKSPEKSLETIIRAQNEGISLWRLFVILALIALLAEIVVVRWNRPTHRNISQ